MRSTILFLLVSLTLVILILHYTHNHEARVMRAVQVDEVGENYVFTLNDEPFTPEVMSLSGDPEHPQPGDVIQVGGILLTLVPERVCHFRITPDKYDPEKILLVGKDGRESVIGVRIFWNSGKKQYTNLLATLSEEELAGLWGVYVDDCWNDDRCTGPKGQHYHYLSGNNILSQ